MTTKRDAAMRLKVEVRSKDELRNWLVENHHLGESVWLVTFKKSAADPALRRFYLPCADVVDELLCFGWNDSVPQKLDANRTMLLISPRRPGSAWSAVNKEKVARLTATKRMTKFGNAAVNAAKLSGTWDALNAVDALVVPDDLRVMLAQCPRAEFYFGRFPPSSRRGILEWLESAKRVETRNQRLRSIVEKAKDNRKANFPSGRDAGPKLREGEVPPAP